MRVFLKDSLKGIYAFLISVVLIVLFIIPPVELKFLSLLFPSSQDLLYPRAPLGSLLLEHLVLSGISSIIACVTGVTLGIVVTRKFGRDFLPVSEDFTSLLQTFPPVAILALSVPLIGFGTEPAVFALILYSILPVVKNTIAGIRNVPDGLKESARGMGMTSLQILLSLELPMAARVIFAGIRISVIINIGTATIGAVVGAGGLGAPIVSGLSRNNSAYVFQGALMAALLAFSADRLFGYIEKTFFYTR